MRTMSRFRSYRIVYLPAGLIAAIVLAFWLNPWPGVLVIRLVFDVNTAKAKSALEKHDPGDVALIANQQYRAGDDDALLDVYIPNASDVDGAALPTLIWTHGGAWVSGDKEDDAPYFRVVASRGYTVVSLNYSLGPQKQYPTAVMQLNDALAFLQQNVERFRIDVNNLYLGGDSSGAQLASQIAVLTTNPAYAAQLGVTPSLQPAQLRGVALVCGVYDMHSLVKAPGIFGFGIRVGMWAYTGSREIEGNAAFDEMSTIDSVTADFPPAFITGGNGDPLTDLQSKPFAAKLTGLDVQTETLFFPPDYRPELGHEYQFNLDLAAGRQSLEEMLAFMAAHVQAPSMATAMAG